jgi:MFS family permease
MGAQDFAGVDGGSAGCHGHQFCSKWRTHTLSAASKKTDIFQTLGYDSSVMNNLNILPSYTEYFHLNTTTTSLLTAAGWVGNMIGVFVMIPIADRYGRKMTIIVAAVVCFIGTILQAASQNMGMFITARIIVGLGSVIGNAGAPTLVAELMPARTRGRMLGIFFSCYYVGSLMSSIISYGSQNIQSTWAWRLPSLLMFLFSALTLFFYPMCPESPRYLISKGEFEHAREVLIVMQGEHTDVDKGQTELVEIRAVMHKEAEDSPRNPWIELFATKGNRKRLFVVASFGLMIELCGNFVISFYLTNILTQAGITDPTTQTQINVILNCWCFAVAILGSFMLDISGRRIQILISLAGMAVMLYVTGGLIKGKYQSPLPPRQTRHADAFEQYMVRARTLQAFTGPSRPFLYSKVFTRLGLRP